MSHDEKLYRKFVGLCLLSAEAPLRMSTKDGNAVIRLGDRELVKPVDEFLNEPSVNLLEEMGVMIDDRDL